MTAMQMLRLLSVLFPDASVGGFDYTAEIGDWIRDLNRQDLDIPATITIDPGGYILIQLPETDEDDGSITVFPG